MSSQESSQNLANVNSNGEGTAAVAVDNAAENQSVIISPVVAGLADLTVIKQVGLMLAVAFSVAVGVAIVLWSQAPTYDLLFSNLAQNESGEVLEALDRLEVEYKIDGNTGAIMVGSGQARNIKLKLAGEGLPRTDNVGYELLDKESSFTTSKNVEMKRFQQVLEGEISRTIMAIDNVKTAKVLLALPKQSVFVRKKKKPSASVILSLYRGRSLEKSQIEAIVHLVASSVPMMEASQVTLVDQRGRLLNSNDNSGLSATIKQFDYKREIEDHLMARIENILMPIVGREGLRVQISADVDFSEKEQTQEQFSPEVKALRSEKTSEDLSSMSAIQGVPGALSNQPPPAGVAPELAVGTKKKASDSPSSSSKTAMRNFEVDKTITHTRLATGGLRKLSVAVVIDDQKIVNEAGEVSYAPFSADDLVRLTGLVEGAIGYNKARGDRVILTNATFRIPNVIESLPEIPVWEQNWFMDLMKQVLAAIVLLFIIFGVLRPTMKGLVARIEGEEEERPDFILDENGVEIAVRYDDDGNMILVTPDKEADLADEDMEDLLLLDSPLSYERRLAYIQKLVDEDPALVAQVIGRWVSLDGA